MNAQVRLIHVSTFPDWIVWVSYSDADEYRCWVRTPEGAALHDGERYASEEAALEAGRIFIYFSLEPEIAGEWLGRQSWSGGL
ncbi:hypothetical protein C1752_12217 [Acaryochloris thomasi RCC1774]|uniref:Uncharacterized protein n=1 Tax=Acaryochloris thomasi RCC1774 TaxID=1764569 RepID=A0A2W1JJJ8_9CYAN|nr:hypothetical protein [Acaryochloris thomasi]PZD70434.1 hypothetical protein C1752_12217 [Acaryochloris thomasi RCC1774]